MLKIGLIGIGFMGRTHLENYIRLEREGLPIQVVALCDIDQEKLEGRAVGGNIDAGSSAIDFNRFAKYRSIDDMLKSESLDMVDITLPSYLHKEVSVQCLNQGLHVMCEKPMALSSKDCEAMIAASKENGKQLMIGQCLRFWPAYEYLKELVDDGTYGNVLSCYFFRGGGTPTWGEWLLHKEQGGGAMADMHVHDTDAINWLFGKPSEVSTDARNVIPGSGYDIVSTHYKYDDGKVINAQVDWTLQGDFGFDMHFRVNFEKGNILFQGNELKVNPNDTSGFTPELSPDLGYYFELKYFVESVMQDRSVTKAAPVETMTSIQIIEAEIKSADRKGAWVGV